MDGHCAEPPRRANGNIPNGIDAAQQQRMVAGYPTQQMFQGQTAHVYGCGSQQTNAPIFQLPQTSYEHPQFYVVPSPAHSYTHAPAPTPSMYAAPISPVETQWARDGSTQSQEQRHFTGSPIHPQPAQPYQPQPYTSDTHATGTYQACTLDQACTLAAPFCSGTGSIPQPSPIASGNTPNALLIMRSASSPVGPRGIVVGGLGPASASASQVQPECYPPFYGGNSIQCPPATDDVPNSFHRVRSGTFAHSPSEQYSWASDQVPSLNLRHPTQLSSTTPYYDQSSASMLTPASYVLPSVQPRPTPVKVFSPADDPSSHEPPSVIQANLTTSGQIANYGAERSGSDSDKSSSFSRKFGPDRRDRVHTRRESKPYQCTTPSASRKTRPIMYEGDLEQLQKRCKEQGADDGAVGSMGRIFAKGVNLEALMLRLMDAGVETEEFESGMGKAYTAFLESTNEFGVLRYICRLCHCDQTWKHSKDVLRHLKRDHFGFADVCNQWYVFSHLLMLASVNVPSWNASNQNFYTKGELTRHPCKQIERN